MERQIKTENRFAEEDLTKPIKIDSLMSNVDDADCFGKAWDLRSPECPRCSERDICGIVFSSKVKKKVEEVQRKQGAIFLDLTDFKGVTGDDVKKWVDSGVTTTKELVIYVMAKACTSDKVASIEFCKRLVRDTEGLSIKNKIVWVS